MAEMEKFKSAMEQEFQEGKNKTREEIENLEVRTPMHSSNLHQCTVIHHGVDGLSLDCCPM